MARKLIIDGNAVYELDENCMLTKQLEQKERTNRNHKPNVTKKGKK